VVVRKEGRRELEFGFGHLDKPGVRRSSKLTPEGATLACAISALRAETGPRLKGTRFVLHNSDRTKVVVSEPISRQSQCQPLDIKVKVRPCHVILHFHNRRGRGTERWCG
jgi:hypothetical protein